VATSHGGTGAQTLRLSAPAGQEYVAFANIEALAHEHSQSLKCKLLFGPAVEQSIVDEDSDPEITQATAQGAGRLESGAIELRCASHGGKDVIKQLSLIAYVVSGIN
jgi:hypothetical protein